MALVGRRRKRQIPRGSIMFNEAAKLTCKVHLPGGQRRLKEAALYVIQKVADAEIFGLVKLNH